MRLLILLLLHLFHFSFLAHAINPNWFEEAEGIQPCCEESFDQLITTEGRVKFIVVQFY